MYSLWHQVLFQNLDAENVVFGQFPNLTVIITVPLSFIKNLKITVTLPDIGDWYQWYQHWYQFRFQNVIDIQNDVQNVVKISKMSFLANSIFNRYFTVFFAH